MWTWKRLGNHKNDDRKRHGGITKAKKVESGRIGARVPFTSPKDCRLKGYLQNSPSVDATLAKVVQVTVPRLEFGDDSGYVTAEDELREMERSA